MPLRDHLGATPPRYCRWRDLPGLLAGSGLFGFEAFLTLLRRERDLVIQAGRTIRGEAGYGQIQRCWNAPVGGSCRKHLGLFYPCFSLIASFRPVSGVYPPSRCLIGQEASFRTVPWSGCFARAA